MKKEILRLLKLNKDTFISGEKISQDLGVSRAAIWKYMSQLKEDGYEIESVSKKGYKLISTADILNYEEIKEYLTTSFIGRNIEYYSTIDSTNTKAKSLASIGEKDGTVIISEEQTLGKGRLGRNWSSPKFKGIWMSIILTPEMDPMSVAKITQLAAAAVYMALAEIGFSPLIKWPNDIIINNKKVCGILTEMSSELNHINYIVLGIGINVNQDLEDFTEEIKDIATSLKECSNSIISRPALTAKILNNFETYYTKFVENNDYKEAIDICRKHSVLLGKEINIIRKGAITTGKALFLNDEGDLIVEYKNGSTEKLISGEVSVRNYSPLKKV